jgi:hypothetical protein
MNKIIKNTFDFFIDENVNKIFSRINYAVLFILMVLYLSGGITGSAILLETKSGLHIELGIALFLGFVVFLGFIIDGLLRKMKKTNGETYYSEKNHSWVVFFFGFSLLTFWYFFQLNCDHLELVSDNSEKIVYVSSEKNIEILQVIYKTLIIYFGMNALLSPYLFYQVGRGK